MIGLYYLVVYSYPWVLLIVGPAGILALMRVKSDGSISPGRLALISASLLLEFLVFFFTKPYDSLPIVIGQFHGSSAHVFATWGAGFLLAATAWVFVLPGHIRARINSDELRGQLIGAQFAGPLLLYAPLPRLLLLGRVHTLSSLISSDYCIVVVILVGWYAFRTVRFWKERGSTQFMPVGFARRTASDLLPFLVFSALAIGYTAFDRESPYHLYPGARAAKGYR